MRTKLFHISFIITATIALILLGLYIFFSLRIQSVFGVAEMASHERLALETKAKQLTTIKSLILSTTEKREELDKHFVTSDDIVPFIQYIESLDTLSGGVLEIDAVDIATLSEKPVLSVSLNMSGTYSQVYRLLRMLEEMPYEISLSSLTLNVTEFNSVVGTLIPEIPEWKASIDFTVISFSQV